MTADMTCDRLRYRLHDMHRSLSLFLSLPLSRSFPHNSPPPPFRLTLAHPPPCLLSLSFSLAPAIADGKYATRTACTTSSRSCVLRNRRTLASNKTNNVEFIIPSDSLTLIGAYAMSSIYDFSASNPRGKTQYQITLQNIISFCLKMFKIICSFMLRIIEENDWKFCVLIPICVLKINISQN